MAWHPVLEGLLGEEGGLAAAVDGTEAFLLSYLKGLARVHHESVIDTPLVKGLLPGLVL